MAIYLLITVSTVGIAAIVDAINNHAGKVILMTMIIAIFCYFAAARDITIGTDTAGYGYATFRGARAYSLSVFLSNHVYSNWGFLYKFVTWIASNLFGTFAAMLFAIELCVVVPVVIVGYKFTNCHLALVVALFSLYFYPLSFNLMRQFMAMGFLLVAWYDLDRKKTIGYFIWLVIAILFHSSAILGLLIFVIDLIARPGKTPYKYKACLFILISLIGLLLLPNALNVIAPFLPHYGAYIMDSTVAISGHGYRDAVEYCAAFAILYVLAKVLVGRKNLDYNSAAYEKARRLLLITLFGVIVTGISPFSVHLGRVGTYFLYFVNLLIPTAADLIPGKSEQFFFMAVSIAVMALLALDLYVITGQNEVFPYVFSNL